MQENWKVCRGKLQMQANISNIVHHFQGQNYFRAEWYRFKQYNMFFCGERKEREKRLTGLGSGRYIKQKIYQYKRGGIIS